MKGKFVQSLDMTLPAELFVNPPSGRFSMALLTDLLNIDLSSLTDKIIAEYIWIGGSGMDLRSKARDRCRIPVSYRSGTTTALIAEFANLPLIPVYLDPRNKEFGYGANFASGGAGALVESHAGLAVDLKTQLQYFRDLQKQFRQELGDSKAAELLSDAVYLFSCGGNDV